LEAHVNLPAPYMRWAKTRPRVTYDLASSGLMPVATRELLGDVTAAEAFDISGPTDEGFVPLREAIAWRYGTTSERVSIAAGASGANFQAMLALLEPGDDALIETPAYDPLIAAARAAGANVVHFERSWSKGFALDPYVVRTALTPSTKLIVISNAHNPSGAMAGRDALEQVGVMAEAIGARVLVDEVYAEAQVRRGATTGTRGQIWRRVRIDQQPDQGLRPRRLRCGWIIASPPVSERVRAIRDVIDGSGPYVAERLSLTAFEHIDRLKSRSRQILAENLSIVRAMAQSHPRLEWLEPAAGTTAFPRVKDVDDTSELVERLIRDHDTIVVPGHFFQAPQHIRIAFGGKTDMVKEAVARLSRALLML
jgi:aspartate/methionine/tyrosine aminotransferase